MDLSITAHSTVTRRRACHLGGENQALYHVNFYARILGLLVHLQCMLNIFESFLCCIGLPLGVSAIICKGDFYFLLSVDEFTPFISCADETRRGVNALLFFGSCICDIIHFYLNVRHIMTVVSNFSKLSLMLMRDHGAMHQIIYVWMRSFCKHN